jgi:hypothetical protein
MISSRAIIMHSLAPPRVSVIMIGHMYICSSCELLPSHKVLYLYPSADSSPAANFKLPSLNCFPAAQHHDTSVLLHPCHVPVAINIGIQRATDGLFMHPSYFQRAADGPPDLHPKEQPDGPLVHSKSCPSDCHHLPSIGSQRSSPPVMSRPSGYLHPKEWPMGHFHRHMS